MTAKEIIGTSVRIRRSMEVSQDLWGRWGEIVEGPRKLFGSTKYKVRIDLQGRETTQQTLWLPAKCLLVHKDATEGHK